jgi:circadian clock protein KaiB
MKKIRRENSKGSGVPETIANKEYVFRLYITGATPNSLRAVTNLKNICEMHIAGKYSLEIIDVYKDQERAEKEQIVALPMLIKLFPEPQRKLIGDLSNTQRVLDLLSIIDLG